MALSYRAELKYSYGDSGDQRKWTTIPIGVFAVGGGPSRSISMKNISEVSLTSELEQARSYKNIDMGMVPMPGVADMRVQSDLINAHSKKSNIDMNFYVYKFIDGKAAEGFHLFTPNAKLIRPPQVKAEFLSLHFELPADVELKRIIYNPGKKPKAFPM